MAFISLNLDFEIPIWTFVYDSTKPVPPPNFEYNGKKYNNCISIIHIYWIIDAILPEIISSLKNYTNPIFCAPDDYSFNILKNNNINCVLANHNAFLNEDVYNIINNTDKKYDLCINSCFEPYKRRHLANKIKNSVNIGYFQTEYEIKNNMINNYNGFFPNFKNNIRTREEYKILSTEEIVKYYNESLIGGIFSPCEGACYSSSEQLLCGIPIISTHSKGGRDVWYNDDNSIICDDNETAVYDAFILAKKNIENGKFKPEKIRSMHIELMEKHRDNLTNAVLDILSKIIINVPEFNELKISLKNWKNRLSEDILKDHWSGTFNKKYYWQ